MKSFEHYTKCLRCNAPRIVFPTSGMSHCSSATCNMTLRLEAPVVEWLSQHHPEIMSVSEIETAHEQKCFGDKKPPGKITKKRRLKPLAGQLAMFDTHENAVSEGR